MQGILGHSTNKLTNITANTFVIVRYFTFSGKNMPIVHRVCFRRLFDPKIV